tara:strand:+ start:115 stop:1326 length:1212 start_codon:yes stop_codon:yes gene_type:complete
MVKELITRADAIIAEVRGETEGASNAKISKPKNNLATFLKLHKGEHEKTSAQLDAILNVLKKDNKLEKKEADADRKERQRQKREKREKLIESLKSGVGSAASAGKKVVSTLVAPFRDVWEKIADFLKFTVIGVLFNSALNWFGEDENIDKIKRIGRFLNFWWPSLLAGFALFFTPIGSFVAGAVGILTTALPTLAAVLSSPLFLKLAGLGLLGLGVGAIGKMLGKDKVSENLAEEEVTKTNKLIEEGMDPGDAAVLSQSTRLPDAGGPGSTNNLKSPTDMLQLRNDPLDGGFNRYNQGGTVAGSGNEDSVPALLRPREVVIPASEGGISKTPYIAPKMRGGQGGNIRPPSTIKISNSVVLPAIRKEKPKKEVREGSTIPTFQISSNANSRQYTLMGMGLEGMV